MSFPPPQSLMALGKECVGTDLKRGSETRLKLGCGAGDKWGGGLKGLVWATWMLVWQRKGHHYSDWQMLEFWVRVFLLAPPALGSSQAQNLLPD